MHWNFNQNRLKSKHIIDEGEDHKTIQAQEEIRSQCVIKEMSLFEATKKKPDNLEKLFYALTTIKPKLVETERAFSATGLFVTKLRNRLNDESVLCLSCVSIINIIEKVCLIYYSLTNCAGTNSRPSNFTLILSFFSQNRIHFKIRKKRVFPGFFSQLPETRVLKFFPELETLV